MNFDILLIKWVPLFQPWLRCLTPNIPSHLRSLPIGLSCHQFVYLSKHHQNKDFLSSLVIDEKTLIKPLKVK